MPFGSDSNFHESAAVSYLTNGLGQRVFRSEPTAEQTLPNQDTLGTDFITWLKKQFGWLFTQAAANTSIGTAYLYADAGAIPSWALLGEYDNGSATGKGRTEYIWLPTEDGQAIPVGILRNGKLFSIHPDHLGTPRVMKNEQNEVVWQWPYSGFGNNKPTGVLKATPNPNAAITNQPVLLKATNPTELNLRFPGQYAEDAGGVVYNYFRNYDPRVGRYTQADPIGLAGGINRYVYAEQNSASISDPFGLNPIEVFGKPQVTRTLGHDIASMTIGDAATICKKVSEIHYNRSLAAITGDVSAGKLRPDVVLVYPNGKMRLYEVPSSSQTVEQMNSKMSAMMKSLKSLGIDCTCETVTVDSAKQGKFTVRALGLLNMLSLTGGIADLYRAQSADPNLTTIEGLYILNGTPLPKRELD